VRHPERRDWSGVGADVIEASGEFGGVGGRAVASLPQSEIVRGLVSCEVDGGVGGGGGAVVVEIGEAAEVRKSR